MNDHYCHLGGTHAFSHYDFNRCGECGDFLHCSCVNSLKEVANRDSDVPPVDCTCSNRYDPFWDITEAESHAYNCLTTVWRRFKSQHRTTPEIKANVFSSGLSDLQDAAPDHYTPPSLFDSDLIKRKSTSMDTAILKPDASKMCKYIVKDEGNEATVDAGIFAVMFISWIVCTVTYGTIVLGNNPWNNVMTFILIGHLASFLLGTGYIRFTVWRGIDYRVKRLSFVDELSLYEKLPPHAQAELKPLFERIRDDAKVNGYKHSNHNDVRHFERAANAVLDYEKETALKQPDFAVERAKALQEAVEELRNEQRQRELG